MIDSHMHLEQGDYDKDRDELVKELKKELKAVITVCADIGDWEKTRSLVEKYKEFVFATAAIHPQHIGKVKKKEIEDFIDLLREEAKKGNLVGIGECGLDYNWVKDEKLREKQKEMFIQFIKLAKEVKLPLVVHSWNSDEEVIKILEDEGMKGKKVLLHQFEGKRLVEKIKENRWFVSIGPGVQRSKNRRKLARDLPLNQITLETDSPWFGDGKRGTPLNVKKAAEKIAEIKKISVKEVEEQTDLNSIKLFNLSKLFKKV